jgi:hypothetical protein
MVVSIWAHTFRVVENRRSIAPELARFDTIGVRYR